MTDHTPINLNISDISDAVKVIDHASDKGAFCGWTNIRQILALRDRLELFVTSAATIAASEPEPFAIESTSPQVIETNNASLPPRRQRRRIV